MEFNIDESLGFLVSNSYFRLRNNLQKRITQYGITPEQWVILNKLYQKDGYTQKELSTQVAKDQASLTRMLDRLEKRYLIKRTVSPTDRRAFEIYITEKGRSLREEIVPIDIEALEEATKIYTQEELQLLKGLLKRLINHLN
jgi:DNA-binding MarR family transcriptional regulator